MIKAAMSEDMQDNENHKAAVRFWAELYSRSPRDECAVPKENGEEGIVCSLFFSYVLRSSPQDLHTTLTRNV